MLFRGFICGVVLGVLIASATLALAQDKTPGDSKTPQNGAGEVERINGPPPGAAGYSSGVAAASGSRIPPLNYNYWHPAPGAPGGQLPARLYLCPRPVPAYVGHTYYTYPPFAPHNWMWEHVRAYYRNHPGGGYTVTTMEWMHDDGHRSWWPWSH